MRRKSKTGRSSPIVPSSSLSAEEYLDIDQWPHRWRVEDRDLRPGEQMLVVFKPFLLHLLSLSLARKTLRPLRDHLCALGGEIIRCLHENPQLRRRSIERVLADNPEEDGDGETNGPIQVKESAELVMPHIGFLSRCRVGLFQVG
jgi:hypothetical protein